MRKLQSRWEWVKNKEKRVGKFKNKENITKYKTREIVEIKKEEKKGGEIKNSEILHRGKRTISFKQKLKYNIL